MYAFAFVGIVCVCGCLCVRVRMVGSMQRHTPTPPGLTKRVCARDRTGEICALFGVECSSGDTFTEADNKAAYLPSMTSMFVPEPVMSLAVSPKDRMAQDNFSKSRYSRRTAPLRATRGQRERHSRAARLTLTLTLRGQRESHSRAARSAFASALQTSAASDAILE